MAAGRDTTAPEVGQRTTVETFDRLRETVQHLIDNGHHHPSCPRSRAAMRLCACGWDFAKKHAEVVLVATLDGPAAARSADRDA